MQSREKCVHSISWTPARLPTSLSPAKTMHLHKNSFIPRDKHIYLCSFPQWVSRVTLDCPAQEILRRLNEPRRAASGAEAPPASLWHAMQQREAPGSSSSEEGEQGAPQGSSAWLEDGAGGLFEPSHTPARAPWRQLPPPQITDVHAPAIIPGRHRAVQEEHDGVDDEEAGGEDSTEAGYSADASSSIPRHSGRPGPERSELSNSMMGNLMNTMRR